MRTAEALVLEPSIVEAFHKLQKLHDEWREIGPVANEYKEVLWNRFKEASSRINKQHQEFFENIKQEQLRNLELKSELCVKAEELAQQPLTSTQRVEQGEREATSRYRKSGKRSDSLPRKITMPSTSVSAMPANNLRGQAYLLCRLKGEMEHNLQLKTELCERPKRCATARSGRRRPMS